MENIHQAAIGSQLLVSKLGTKAFSRHLGEKGLKLLDLFTVQQKQVHKLRIQL